MVDALGTAIDTLAVSSSSLAHDGDALARALALYDRLRAVLVRAVGEFDALGLWELDGATSMPAWLRTHARQSNPTAASFAATARRLRTLPATEAAAVDGTLSADQVKILLANVRPHTEPLFREIEEALVPLLAPLSIADTLTVARDWAAHAEVVTEGDLPRETEGAQLSQLPDGTWQLDAHLGAEGGRLVEKAIAATITTDVDGEPVRTASQRRADALVDVCRWFLDHREEPPAVRNRPHLDVTQSIGAWETGGPAMLSGTTPLSAAAAQRLACDAAMHRVLTVGRSHIIDYGTATRTVSPALFRVVALRDRHCRFPGCDRPPSWCEAHHIVPVTRRGPTRQENLALFCTRHHHLLHLPGWRASMTVDGVVTVTTALGRTLTSAPLPLVGTMPLPLAPPLLVTVDSS